MWHSMDFFTCNIMKLNHEKCLFAGLYLAHIISLKVQKKINVSASLLYDYVDCFFFLSIYSVIYLVSYTLYFILAYLAVIQLSALKFI